MVASLLSFGSSSRSAASSAPAASRTRGQPADTTLPAADASHGSGTNEPTMDRARGALVPLAKGLRLRGSQVRWGAESYGGEVGVGTHRRARMEPHAGKRRPVWTASSPKTGPKSIRKELVDLSTISNSC